MDGIDFGGTCRARLIEAIRDRVFVSGRHNVPRYLVNGSENGQPPVRTILQNVVGGIAMKSSATPGSSHSPAGEPLGAHEAIVRSVLSKDLEGVPGKELLMLTVEYPPGSVDPVHTHHAQTLVYVLEGSIVMQVRGGDPSDWGRARPSTRDRTTCTSWAETRATPHPAKLLVLLVKDKGAPILTVVT